MTATRADTVGIVGAGPFGTALASVLGRHGRRVILWSHDAAVVAAIDSTRRCPRLPAAPLPASVEATTDLKRLGGDARFIVLAVVSENARDRARSLGDVIDGSHIVVHAIGGLSPHDGRRISEVLADNLPTLKLGALAGPALPKDLADGAYSSMVVASSFDEVLREGRRLLNAAPLLRVYANRDLAGVELASALAGAYTVTLGLADGLEVPAGPRAVLITRCVAEASRLGVAAGAEARTFAGLAGLGNLLVRASGDKSDDYVLGRRFADGSVKGRDARTEGARAAIAAVELANKLKVRVPVLTGLALVLAGTAEPREAARLIGETVAEEE
jgi:glycerol-3-phosphate dehydrogenase (NAD(P)+)